jgi:hypothetical protein
MLPLHGEVALLLCPVQAEPAAAPQVIVIDVPTVAVLALADIVVVTGAPPDRATT